MYPLLLGSWTASVPSLYWTSLGVVWPSEWTISLAIPVVPDTGSFNWGPVTLPSTINCSPFFIPQFPSESAALFCIILGGNPILTNEDTNTSVSLPQSFGALIELEWISNHKKPFMESNANPVNSLVLLCNSWKESVSSNPKTLNVPDDVFNRIL